MLVYRQNDSTGHKYAMDLYLYFDLNAYGNEK